MNDIWFDGVSLSTFGVVPNGSGVLISPERDYTVTEVPGRNGNIIIDNGRYGNTAITYSCYISKHFHENFTALKGFLLSRSGYCRLEDTYTPDYYRTAYFAASVEPELTANYKGGSFELTFNCKPQRFLKSGESAITFVGGGTEYFNPSYEVQTMTYSEMMAGYEATPSKSIYRVVHDIMYYYMSSSYSYIFINLPTTGKTRSVIVKDENETGSSFLGYMHSYTEGKVGYNSSSTGSIQAYVYDTAPTGVAILKKTNQKIFLDDVLVYADAAYSHDSITNATKYNAKPDIELRLSSTLGTDYVSLCTIRSKSIYAKRPSTDCTSIFVDSETMDAYSIVGGTMINMNPYIQYVDEIQLEPGANDISVRTGVTLLLTPRWWTV